MGLMDKLFGKRRPAGQQLASLETFTAYTPQFTSWSGRIYESALVREAIYAKARHIMKLKFDMRGSAHRSLYNAVKVKPNPWHTWPDFLEQCNNIYEVENNLIIIPVLDDLGDIKGFWPVYPSGSEVREDKGDLFLVYQAEDGQRRGMELYRCAIIRKHQLTNTFFGEGNAPLAPTMSLQHTFEESIEESVKSAASYKFMAQVTNYMFNEDLAKERKRFDKLNFKPGEGGGLLLFNSNVKDIKQLEAAKNLVDKDQQELIEKNVWRWFGVSEAVIMNTAKPDELSGFFDGEIEPFSIKMSDALTSMIYSDRELTAGNKAILAANRLQYMSVPDKVSMSQQLGDRGALMIDEIRDLFNYPPLEDGAGQHAPIRGEYYFVDQGRPDQKKDDKKDGGENDA